MSEVSRTDYITLPGLVISRAFFHSANLEYTHDNHLTIAVRTYNGKTPIRTQHAAGTDLAGTLSLFIALLAQTSFYGLPVEQINAFHESLKEEFGIEPDKSLGQNPSTPEAPDAASLGPQ